MNLEDILYEDKIAVPVWVTFTISAAFKPIMAIINGGMHDTIQTFISILPALCGAYLGYRHVQSIQAFKLEKMRAEHALERERIASARQTPLSDHTDTVDLP
jgi:hypothetical protein